MAHDAGDVAIPILPARDLHETRAFYARLGFESRLWEFGGGYLIARHGTVEVHFFGHRELDPWTSHAGCYWRVADADAWWRACATLDLPDHGIPRLTPPADRDWGMREFALVDPNGNLVRVGHPRPEA